MNRKSQSQLKFLFFLVIPCVVLIFILLFVSASSTQYAYPNQDVSIGSWSDGGSAEVDGVLWNSMDEETQDGDDSYATGTQNAGPFEVNLTDVADPEGNTGHIVHVYGKGVGSGGPEKVDMQLYEGATLIATIANNWAPGRSAYVDVAYTLDAGEADAIGDYSNLIVRVVEDSINGGEEFRITQIYMEFPDAPSDPFPIASLGTNPIADFEAYGTALTFELSCSDDTEVDTIQLWTNSTGTWHNNKTINGPVNDTIMETVIPGLTNGTYIWGVWCNDSIGQGNWSDSNRTYSVNDAKWLSGWDYRKAINVSVSSGTTQELYQIKMNISYDSNMNSNFSDLRFVTGNILSYWVENKVDDSYVDIWVEINQPISTINYTLYMYYGNVSTLNESNGTLTFDVFDDFNDNNFNTKLWSTNLTGTDTVVETNQELQLQGTTEYDGVTWRDDLVYIKLPFTGNYSAQARVKVDSIASTDVQAGISLNTLSYPNDDLFIWLRIIGADYHLITDDGLKTYTSSTDTNYHNYNVTNNDSYRGCIDNECNMTEIGTGNALTYFSLQKATYLTEEHTTYYDDVIVRKYNDPEPVYYMEIVLDTNPPQWFDNSTNSTQAGTYIGHSVRWTNTGLSGYIFEFDNGTGTFNNDSFIEMTGTNNWSNVTKYVNETEDSTIRWRIYANDTASPTNWNQTSIFTYDTTSADTCSPDSPLTANYNFDCSDDCIVSSGIDAGGYDVSITGTGTFTMTADIYNFNDIYVAGTSSSERCIVTCNGGCFKD